MLLLPCSLTPLHTTVYLAHVSQFCSNTYDLFCCLTIHMTTHLSAHYCAAVLTPYAYASPYFTMTLTLIISLSYVLCSI